MRIPTPSKRDSRITAPCYIDLTARFHPDGGIKVKFGSVINEIHWFSGRATFRCRRCFVCLENAVSQKSHPFRQQELEIQSSLFAEKDIRTDTDENRSITRRKEFKR